LKYYFSLHLKDREVLEKYRNQPFPHYEKLKAILRCIESTSAKLPFRHEAVSPAVECPRTIIQLPDQLPQSLSPDPFMHTNSATSSAATTSFFPAPSTTSSLPSTAFLQADHQSCPASSSSSAPHFPLAWSPNQEISRSCAQDYQPAAPSLSFHSPSTSAIQQSGLPFPASFDALESQQNIDAIQLSADDQRQAVSAFPVSHLSWDSDLLSLPSSSIHHSTLSLPSGLQSVAVSSTGSSKRRRVDDTQFSNHSAPPALSAEDITNRVITHVTTLVDKLRGERIPSHPSPPSMPSMPSVSPLPLDVVALTKATNLLSAAPELSLVEKVQLRNYFGNHITDAVSLPEENAPYLAAIFQNILGQLNQSNQ
jgi:hypothetical protein